MLKRFDMVNLSDQYDNVAASTAVSITVPYTLALSYRNPACYSLVSAT
jgi:hypothetical protein